VEKRFFPGDNRAAAVDTSWAAKESSHHCPKPLVPPGLSQ
jgi:hypothetical protein